MSSPTLATQLDHWLQVVSPTWNWQWDYLVFIRQQLAKITDGSLKRLILTVPPRHGKSEMVTVRYSAWRLECDPALKVIIGAYNQTLANKFSRKVRRIAESRMPISRERAAVEDWETQQGGGVRAVGVGSGITGQGGNLVIIDDPIKNREEANSEVYRERVWEWYRDDLYTRLEPDAALVLIQTRWHDADLVGRILASDDAPNWTLINFSALAEEDDPLGREVGQSLCPDRYDEVALASIREVLGNSFYALYQGRPRPQDGEMFKREWFKDIVDISPIEARRVRYWDKAGTSDAGAYTAGVKIAEYGGLYFIEDVRRGQWGSADREVIIKQTAQLDGVRTSVYVEQEPGSGGKESAEATIRNLAGFIVHADRVTGDKVTRAEPLAAQAQAGNIKIVRGDWNNKYLDELTSFPSGRYKDQVDATSGAFNKIVVQYMVTSSVIDGLAY